MLLYSNTIKTFSDATYYKLKFAGFVGIKLLNGTLSVKYTHIDAAITWL